MDNFDYIASASRFVIALLDPHDPTGTTVHAFDDSVLWEWLTRPEMFPEGEEEIELQIPGTDLTAFVSHEDPLTDKAQVLVWLPGQQGLAHPSLTSLDFGPSDTAAFQAAYTDLVAEIGVDHVIEGRW